MTKEPCRQCGADSVVIHDGWAHMCSPCWIEKFIVNADQNKNQRYSIEQENINAN